MMDQKPELRKYEVIYPIVMPGNSKSNDYKIIVEAINPADALVKAEELWRQKTDPTDFQDIRIKEIAPIKVA